LITEPHLTPRLKKEYSYTCIPQPLGFYGLLYGKSYFTLLYLLKIKQMLIFVFTFQRHPSCKILIT
jgi:hypothetical protein